jgi:opacity protein-like surface antigen
LALLVLGSGAAAVHAGNGFFYLGAGVSHNDVSDITSLGDLGDLADIRSTSWKAFVGVRPINLFAVEADYMDLGSGNSTFVGPCGLCNGSTHVDGSAYAAYLVGFAPIPLPVVDLYAKAGAAHWKLNGSVNIDLVQPNFSSSSSGTDFAWGIGAQVHLASVGARLEYEDFKIPNTSSAKITSLSVFLNL